MVAMMMPQSCASHSDAERGRKLRCAGKTASKTQVDQGLANQKAAPALGSESVSRLAGRRCECVNYGEDKGLTRHVFSG
jgi:hypothetical protein